MSQSAEAPTEKLLNILADIFWEAYPYTTKSYTDLSGIRDRYGRIKKISLSALIKFETADPYLLSNIKQVFELSQPSSEINYTNLMFVRKRFNQIKNLSIIALRAYNREDLMEGEDPNDVLRI
jgi:hypothetical protein